MFQEQKPNCLACFDQPTTKHEALSILTVAIFDENSRCCFGSTESVVWLSQCEFHSTSVHRRRPAKRQFLLSWFLIEDFIG